MPAAGERRIATLADWQDSGGGTRSVEEAVCQHHWLLVGTRDDGPTVVFIWECERCGERVERRSS